MCGGTFPTPKSVFRLRHVANPAYRRRIDPGSIQNPCWHGSGIDPASIWHQSGIDPASIQHRSGIDPASIRHRSRIDPASIRHRSGIDPASIQDRSGIDIEGIRDHQGRFLDHQGCPKTSKIIKNQKNHQFSFLRVRFEALDELDRLVILPRVENIAKYAKMY